MALRKARAASHPIAGAEGPRAKLFTLIKKNSCASGRFDQIKPLPNTHVPVVVCRSAGIWTRGQSTALGRPAAGGEPAHPAQRGTRLEATTDRAFLVSVGPPKAGAQRGLSILPGVRTGVLPSKRWLWMPERLLALGRIMATAQHLIAHARSPAALRRRRKARAVASAGSTAWRRVSNARSPGPNRRRILHLPRADDLRPVGGCRYD